MADYMLTTEERKKAKKASGSTVAEVQRHVRPPGRELRR